LAVSHATEQERTLGSRTTGLMMARMLNAAAATRGCTILARDCKLGSVVYTRRSARSAMLYCTCPRAALLRPPRSVASSTAAAELSPQASALLAKQQVSSKLQLCRSSHTAVHVCSHRRATRAASEDTEQRSYDILRILAKITARNANISRIKA
jgi:hypothetical protein